MGETRRPVNREMMIGALLGCAVALAPGCGKTSEETVSPVHVTPTDARDPVGPVAPESLRVRILRQYPHDRSAFTQGLIWHDGVMYESTGQYGESSLRKVRLEDGKVLARRELEPDFFGEGLARVDDHLVQLTWRSGLAQVWDLKTLERRTTLRYRGEGWGLCFDGTALVMSDGSSILEFRDPKSMEVLRELIVIKEGRPVQRLNELECVDSQIYANVWQSNEILRIDSKTGRVTASIDASDLLTKIESRRADVLNGIAYKPDSKTFLVTGKLWPQLFEVELVPR